MQVKLATTSVKIFLKNREFLFGTGIFDCSLDDRDEFAIPGFRLVQLTEDSLGEQTALVP